MKSNKRANPFFCDPISSQLSPTVLVAVVKSFLAPPPHLNFPSATPSRKLGVRRRGGRLKIAREEPHLFARPYIL